MIGFGVDPALEVHDSNGVVIAANDNWGSAQEAEISATGIPPTNSLEAAAVGAIPPGIYTAIVRGAHGETGVAVVEIYGLN